MGTTVQLAVPRLKIMVYATLPAILSVAVLLALPKVSEAAVYTVCASGCDYSSPEAAVNDPLITDGDTIDIETDTYVIAATMQVDNSITILGNNSVIDANGLRAIDVSAGANLSLTNVTMRNGQALPGFGGGALRVSGASVATVIGARFENNQADFGGAVHNSGSTVTIRETGFSGNRATNGSGGAVWTDTGGVTNIVRTTVDGNLASAAGGGLAVDGSSSQLNLISSTVSNNAALIPTQTVSNTAISGTTLSCPSGPGPLGQTFIADAAALSAFEFNIRLNGGDTTVIPNDINIPGQVRLGGPAGPVIATATAFAPGGVWPGSSTQTLTFQLDKVLSLVPGATYAIESFIAGAYSIYISPGNDYADGGGYQCGSGVSATEDYYFRTFGGTPGDGGGIHATASGSAGLFNSTLSGNVGDGAFAELGGTVSTLFSTITDNSGNGLTAQVGLEAPDGLVFFTASIIAGNAGDDCSGDTTSSGYNLIGDDSNCFFTPATGDLVGDNLSPIDPLLGPLQNNGGWTFTHAIDEASPAVGAAGPALALPCSDAADDQRGVARPQDPACDIGAVERVAPLQRLINAAGPAAIIDIPDGVYTESVSIGNNQVLRGSGPGNVVIDATGLGRPAIVATGDFGLQGLRVTGGNSGTGGGGINAEAPATDITLTDTLLDSNTATLNGGAVYLPSGTLIAVNATFSNNSAGVDGGAIFAGSVIDISNSVFDGNNAVTAGGAIFSDGDLTLADTTINGSFAGVGGGIYSNGAGNQLFISGSTFSGNTANNPSNPGAVDAGAIGGSGAMDIRNSTFSGNTAAGGDGGGIGLISGSALLSNVTFASNAALLGRGGAFYAQPTSSISLRNSLLAANTGNLADCGFLTSLGYNIFQNWPCPEPPDDDSDIVADPLLDALASNGGPTQTHALQAASPAINAGHPVPDFTQFDAGNFSLLQSQGSATLDNGALYLAGTDFSAGSAFVTQPIDPTRDFSARFEFLITQNPSEEFIAASDGITFTISDDPAVLGDAGGVLGISRYDFIEGGTISVVNGVSVEFDTWDNGLAEEANDPGPLDHVGIDINGSLSSIALAILGPHGTLSDGNVWTAWIDYDAATNLLEVRTANNAARPALPTVSASVDIAALTGPDAYVGFTGTTGTAGIFGEHRILSFSFEDSCEPVDQVGAPRPQGTACDIGALEGAVVPLELGPVVLSTFTPDQELSEGTSYPGVVDIPIIDIPIERLTGDAFNAPESAPLGSFPLGSFPIGSFDVRNSPLGSFPLGSFPIGSFPIGSFPIGSFPLSAIPLMSAGGWTEILNDIPELAGAPLQTVTLERLMTLNPLPDSVASIELRDLSIEGSPLESLSLAGLSLGDTTVAELDQWASNAGNGETVCETLAAADPGFLACTDNDTLLGLEVQGAPVSALSLSSLPLGSFPIGSFPIGSFPIGSFPLGSFPIGSFPIGSFPIGSFPIGSFPLGSFPIGSFPIGSFNLLAAPTSSLPLGSFPIGSFPIGSFEIDGRSFCEFYDEQALAGGDKTCAELSIDPGADSLADLVTALQTEAERSGDSTGGIASTPLGSFPLGSFPIGSFPIGSFDIGTLSTPPLSVLTLEDFDGCALIESNSTDNCFSLGLDGGSSLTDVAAAYGGSLAASPLGSFPIGSFGIADLPLGSFPIGSFEVNGTPLGSFPLGSFDLVQSPLGSFPIGSFPIGSFATIIDDPDGLCSSCLTLADASKAGVINTAATLSDLAESTEFATTTLGEVLDAMTLAILYGPGTLADIEDTGQLTLGQLLISMMLKTDFPWETIPMEQLYPQDFSADNYVAYLLDVPLTGTESELLTMAVTLDEGFMYVEGSAALAIETPLAAGQATAISDPVIVDNGDGSQTLGFAMTLGGFGWTNNTLSFATVPPLALGDYPANATVQLGGDNPVQADSANGTVTVIPDPSTDISEPALAVSAPADVLLLGYINAPDDNDYYRVAAPAAGDRVAVFMSNPGGDNDLIMYEPLSTVEKKGQVAESPSLDSVPFEDDGVNYGRNITEEPNALEDVNLATAPLASISTNRGGLDESVSAIAGNTEPFTLQVSGYNGAISNQPYTLRIKSTPQLQQSQCTPRDWPGRVSSTVLPAGNWTAETNAVFLVNPSRLAASEGDDAVAVEAADAAISAVNNLVTAPGITDGVVVDVSTIYGVDYTAWDANPCDVDAPNDIVNAITRYLEEQRVHSPKLAYVTIVGSDEIIPFARKPDETSIANESTFAGEFEDNAMYGALVTRHFLSDDTYGDIDPIPWLDRYLNVPELGVGRLVESAAAIRTAANNYIASAGILDPMTALSAGYDFIADASESIDETFNAYAPVLGMEVEPALIDPPGITPASDAWDKADFLAAAGITGVNPVDLVSFNMHFDFDEALPSSGDALGNYTDNLINTGGFEGADLTGGIWFTVGCHSGTSVADVSVVGAAPSEDWAQTFGRLGAIYLAQNAYGLGDTEAVALTERLMVNFARNLNGSMSIGQAHAFAKQQYFASLGLYGEYDYKALQAATLFGLPMYRYGNGARVVDPLPQALPVVTDPLSGLTSASWSLEETGISRTTTESKGELFSVDGEVQFVHFRPLQPILRRDVTGEGGETAAGAFLTSLVTEDIDVNDIAFARPVIDLGENEPEIESDEVVFPTAFTNIASYKVPPAAGGPFVERQQLNVIAGQFTSPPDGKSSGTERLFRSFDAQVFYRSQPASPIVAAATVAAAGDFVRPEFDNVQASVVGPDGARQVAFSVDVFDEGTVLRVAVLYLQSVTDGKGNWVLVDLVRGSGDTWTGGGAVDISGITDGKVDYMVQAVDDNGNVANSTFKGLFHVAEKQEPVPGGGGPGAIDITVSVEGDEVDPGDWIASDPVDVGVTNPDPDTTYVYSVDFAPFRPLTDAGFQISEDGVHLVTVQESDGSNPVTFVILIDTTPPQALITTPANGGFIVQGQNTASEYDCLDSGSGIASCVGTVPDGSPVPAGTVGMGSFTLTTQDYASQDDETAKAVVAEHSYYVVKALDVIGPASSTPVNEGITITASASDLPEFEETMRIDWGDGSPPEVPDLTTASVADISAGHVYTEPGVYQVVVTVDYQGQFTLVGGGEFVIVHDPDGGFINGGGWIESPQGAFRPDNGDDAAVTGKAHFNFESKYKKDQALPGGSTSFRFAGAGLKFESSDYDWMLISGPLAHVKGQGVITGEEGLYEFMVTVIDADVDGAISGRDGFRIKIWRADAGGAETVVYDNGLGADPMTGDGGTTALGGGSITVHTAKLK